MSTPPAHQATQKKPVLVLDCLPEGFRDHSNSTEGNRFRRATGIGDSFVYPFLRGTSAFPEPTIFSAIFIGGSPVNFDEPGESADRLNQLVDFIRIAMERDVPMFGVCFGFQAMALALGGRVEKMSVGEIGVYSVDLTQPQHPLFSGLSSPLQVVEAHQRSVSNLPSHAQVLAENDKAIQAAQFGPRAFGTQFHPEINRRELARLLLREQENHARGVSGITIDDQYIRKQMRLVELHHTTTHGERLMQNFLRIVGHV